MFIAAILISGDKCISVVTFRSCCFFHE